MQGSLFPRMGALMRQSCGKENFITKPGLHASNLLWCEAVSICWCVRAMRDCNPRYVPSIVRSFLIAESSIPHQTIHASFHPCIPAFLHSFIRSFIHSFFLSAFHSFIFSFVRSFIHSCILSFIESSEGCVPRFCVFMHEMGIHADSLYLESICTCVASMIEFLVFVTSNDREFDGTGRCQLA